METETTEGAFALGCEPVVEDVEHRRLLWLMAEYFNTMGCTELKARLPGFQPPPVLSGTIEDFRPDFTCRQSNSGQTPLIAEVVTADDFENPRADNRWSLLFSAARLYQAELHFIVPKWHPKGPLETALRRRLGRMDLIPTRIWNV